MRSLSTEQIIILLVLVGIPLLRALWRWLQEVRRLAAGPRPSGPEPPGASLAALPPRQAGEPGALSRPTTPGRPAAGAARPPEADTLPPGPAPQSTMTPRAHPRRSRAYAVTGPRGSMSLRQAFIWKTILDPPPSLPANVDRR